MNGFKEIDALLKKIFPNLNQKKIAQLCGLQPSNYSAYVTQNKTVSNKTYSKLLNKLYDLGKKHGAADERKRNADYFFGAIQQIHALENTDLHKKIIGGKASSSAYSQYKSGKKFISLNKYVELIGKQTSLIYKPIFEFEECSPYMINENVKGSKKITTSWKLFKDNPAKEQQIKAALYDGDVPKIGVYAMYDSAGRILYFGKAATTTHGLYKEIVQRMKAPVHRDVVFVRDGKFRHLGTVGKKARPNAILVGHMTKYISAIEVPVQEAIGNLEAFVLRLIPNDTVNYKVENIK